MLKPRLGPSAWFHLLSSYRSYGRISQSNCTAAACLANCRSGQEGKRPLLGTPMDTMESEMQRYLRRHDAADRLKHRSGKTSARNSPMLLWSRAAQFVFRSQQGAMLHVVARVQASSAGPRLP